MTQLQLKYNPGFSDDEELIRLFVVRRPCLDFILRTIDENTGPSNQHVLIVGPRGSGKTTLVLRVASELRTNPKYKGWFPVIFAEESYEVSTPGEFWLEALFRLADQSKSERWCRAYEEIKLEAEDVRVRERALAQLLDFATEQGKRILLIVENLNMLLGDQLSDHDAWDLRHTLVNEPRIMMLGTAVTRFSKISNSGKPWFELLAVHTLDPLSRKECSILWCALTDKNLPASQIRPIQILTGGNPRLIRILAEFANKNSFRDLMKDLVHLIDEHTEYFKSQLDTLPAAERKAFVALLDLWDPATARAVARNARMPVSTTSAYLNRLVSRGAVTIAKFPGRKKLYQSAERLYNIYYLMRKRGHPSNRVRAAVRFMVQFYQGRQLVKSAARLAEEACRLEPNLRAEHYLAYEDILHACSEGLRQEIVDGTPVEFFEAPDAPRPVRAFAELKKSWPSGPDLGKGNEEPVSLVLYGHHLMRKNGDWVEAERAFRKAVSINPKYGHAWAHLGQVLYSKAKKYAEAKEDLERAVQLSPDDAWAWYHLGRVLLLMQQEGQAEKSFRNATELRPSDPVLWVGQSDALHDLGRYEEAERACKRAIQESKGTEAASGWGHLGELYHYHLARLQEAEEAYRKSLHLQESGNGWVLLNLANLLADHLGRVTEAEELFRQAELLFRKQIAKDPRHAAAWGYLGEILARNEVKHKEAVEALFKAIESDPTDMRSRHTLLELLVKSGRFEEAERVCRDEIRVKPSFSAWELLGFLLDSTGRFEEAEQSYLKALEFDQLAAWLWFRLGRLQFKGLKKNEQARAALQKATEIEGWKSKAWPTFLQVRLALGEDVGSITGEAERFLQEQGQDPECLNDLAWKLYKSDREDILPEAERLARKALEGNKTNNWMAVHTLSVILGRQGRWREALDIASSFFDAAAESETAISGCIEFAISAASAGYASDVLSTLGESKGKTALEPLEVGLRKFLKESPLTAQEISEVANDVAERIRQMQARTDPSSNRAD
jgi:tetratricopeptide (TPR) repeat protein